MSNETNSPTPNLRTAPLPTERTLRMRKNLPFQAVRFAAFNLRILRMVVKGHH
ncbi:hypothetical protein [Intrasporangium sp.]|uniref:hypothetical protein n=1 Tax=Intrasporangium sp. TaxID=1925024 RepID=UPI00293A9A2E|nr:hypothetical protein [Intrasporangium sp.]MDV3220799.1 hypothetical protein [Intrasporangium sp.]